MDHLRALIEMGFAPMMALVIAAVIVLWLALCSVLLLFWRHNLKERASRDKERKEQIDEINGRLKASEEKHEECDGDREALHEEIRKLDSRLGKFEGCPRASCPMKARG